MKNIFLVKQSFLLTLFILCLGMFSIAGSTNNGVVKKLVFAIPESDYTHPCEVISKDVIKDVFAFDDITIEVANKVSTYPSCRYTWDGDNKTTRLIGGQQMSFDTESAVTIVFYNAPATKKNYDTSIASYTDELEELSVGDNAVWSDKRKQMTVLSGSRLFHVNVDYTPDNTLNKEKAIQLSEVILSTF